MSSYLDWLIGRDMPSHYSGGSPWHLWRSAMDYFYNTTHGKTKYWLSQLPITGRLRQSEDTAQRWEDSYNNTGIDPVYSDTYGGAGRSFINDMMPIGTNPMKMASSLSKMYGAEVALDVQKTRLEAYRQSKKAARAWSTYENLRQNRK